jgi:hypothetical protein
MPKDFFIEIDLSGAATAFPVKPQVDLSFTPYYQMHVGLNDTFEWSYDGKTVHGRLAKDIPHPTYSVPRLQIWFRRPSSASGTKVRVFAQAG